MERILYIWAIRHPGSGYVQGINDLVTPFFAVYFSATIGGWVGTREGLKEMGGETWEKRKGGRREGREGKERKKMKGEKEGGRKKKKEK